MKIRGNSTLDPVFKGRQYPPDIILWAVRWHCRYPLAYRMLEDRLKEREVLVDHATIARWVQVYGPEMERRLCRQPSFVSSSWRVDETSVKIKGKVHWLYRAVDARGNTCLKNRIRRQPKHSLRKCLENPVIQSRKKCVVAPQN
jgi:transposase-like protein